MIRVLRSDAKVTDLAKHVLASPTQSLRRASLEEQVGPRTRQIALHIF